MRNLNENKIFQQKYPFSEDLTTETGIVIGS